jgi:hypothetical protein
MGAPGFVTTTVTTRSPSRQYLASSHSGERQSDRRGFGLSAPQNQATALVASGIVLSWRRRSILIRPVVSVSGVLTGDAPPAIIAVREARAM